MSDVLILVGTVTGNADEVARGLAEIFANSDMQPVVVDMDDANPATLLAYPHIVVCTSTYGDGELPSNAEHLYAALEQERPSLQGYQIAVCALGDHLYDPHFCEAGRRFELLCAELGATVASERFQIDGGPTSDDIEQAQAWALDVVDAFCGTPV